MIDRRLEISGLEISWNHAVEYVPFDLDNLGVAENISETYEYWFEDRIWVTYKTSSVLQPDEAAGPDSYKLIIKYDQERNIRLPRGALFGRSEILLTPPYDTGRANWRGTSTREHDGSKGWRRFDPINEAIEGIATERNSYISKSRSRKLRDQALARSGGVCECCEINFSTLLNGKGTRVLEVHHKKQLALSDGPVLTNSDELAVVCANCHTLIHSDRYRAVSVEKLKKLLAQRSSNCSPEST